MLRFILLFIALPCIAGTHLVLNDTNVSLPAGLATRREFIEPEHYVTVTSNWIDSVTLPGTNGNRLIHQQLVIMTNHAFQFSYHGQNFMEHLPPEVGPIVDKRVLDIPSPVAPPLPLRTTPRIRFKTNIVTELVP